MDVTALFVWDWAITPSGEKLHSVAEIELLDEDDTGGYGTTDCGIDSYLMIPGIFTRLGADRCSKCCAATGMPNGTGSPKNDDRCREIVKKQLGLPSEQEDITLGF